MKKGKLERVTQHTVIDLMLHGAYLLSLALEVGDNA